MKGLAGVQFNAHSKFIEWKKKIKKRRVIIGKEQFGQLSDKRFSLTLVKFFESHPEIESVIINADINLNEDE